MSKLHICKENIIALALFLICYILAINVADYGLRALACVLLIVSAVGSYCLFVISEKNFAALKGLLCLSWEGGLALAILRLSELHTEWTIDSKLSFCIFPCSFLLFSSLERNRSYKEQYQPEADYEKLIAKLIYITAIISTSVFIIEAVMLGYVPAFSKDTHAYNYFHVTGLHYFTVTSMMTHALTMVWFVCIRKWKITPKKNKLIRIIISNLLSAAVALLCVSKLQFLLIFGLPVLIFLASMEIKSLKELPWKKIIILVTSGVLLIAGVLIVFTKLRHYEPGYLQGIFEFRNPETPVTVQYPYMYIANNYANFNCLTENLTEYGYGLRQAFPVFALTGLKFAAPQLVSFNLYVVKEEINTLTLIYDAYYDFGIIGVAVLGALLGVVASFLKCKIKRESNPMWLLLYGQMAIYFVLSFFSAWFSVATTWFWFGITFIYGFVLWFSRRRISHE